MVNDNNQRHKINSFKAIAAAVLVCTPLLSFADTVSFSLCNKYGTGAKQVVVKDKKSGMSKLFQGSIARDACETINAYSSDGKFAEVEITVEQGTPYGVPWIALGSTVDF